VQGEEQPEPRRRRHPAAHRRLGPTCTLGPPTGARSAPSALAAVLNPPIDEESWLVEVPGTSLFARYLVVVQDRRIIVKDFI
jgi:hypothetical protein